MQQLTLLRENQDVHIGSNETRKPIKRQLIFFLKKKKI